MCGALGYDSVCLSLCGHVHMSAYVCGGQRHLSPLEQELQARVKLNSIFKSRKHSSELSQPQESGFCGRNEILDSSAS